MTNVFKDEPHHSTTCVWSAFDPYVADVVLNTGNVNFHEAKFSGTEFRLALQLFETITQFGEGVFQPRTISQWSDPLGKFNRITGTSVHGKEEYLLTQFTRYHPTLLRINPNQSRSLFFVTSTKSTSTADIETWLRSVFASHWDGASVASGGSIQACVACWASDQCNHLVKMKTTFPQLLVVNMASVHYSQAIGYDQCLAQVTDYNSIVIMSEIDLRLHPQLLSQADLYVIPRVSFLAPIVTSESVTPGASKVLVPVLAAHFIDLQLIGPFTAMWADVPLNNELLDIFLRLYRIPLSAVRPKILDIVQVYREELADTRRISAHITSKIC